MTARRPGARACCAAALAALLAAPVVGAPPALAARGCDPTVPDRIRVDLGRPVFSDPTRITNPLFPVGRTTQVVQLGVEGDVRLRQEVTTLAGTRTFLWRGQRVETLVSQFVAYGDGRLLEVATDFFAQADDGAVWYFGEEVENYEDGVVVNRDGTWLAGRDGPPGMIMPARPAVGDAYRPENIPGLVLETVRVRAVGRQVDGPAGVVRGAVVVEECLLDGTTESKVYAPGYGEFRARVAVERELVTVAVAAPTDALPGPVPARLDRLAGGALDLFDGSARGWPALAPDVERLDRVWGDEPRPGRPPLLVAAVERALSSLEHAVEARRRTDLRQSALALAHAGLDLQLSHRPPAQVDRSRLAVWKRQLDLDTETGTPGDVAGDRAALRTVLARLPR